jgi:predicted aspartyl protease
MSHKIWKFGCFAALFLVAAMVEAQTIKVPIEIRSEPRAIFVTAEINGHKARMLLDTGALMTLADPTRIGITESELHLSTKLTTADAHASQAIPVYKTEVRLGGIKFRIPVLLDSKLSLPSGYGHIDGLLGMNVLAFFDSFRIDQKTGVLELTGPREQGLQVALEQ